MKNKLIIISMILLTFVVGGRNKKEETKKLSTDGTKFKAEYEKYNGLKDGNKDYLNVTIDEKNPIKYSTEDEIADLIKNKSGVIYLGFPECPWCRNAVPVLLEAAKETGMQDIYYLNMKDIRDEKVLENKKIVTKKEGTTGYYKLVDLLKEHLDSYDGLNDSTIKRIYVPLVVFVYEGKIVRVHADTVKSQKDPYKALSLDQNDELKKIYKENIHKVLNELCDQTC